MRISDWSSDVCSSDLLGVAAEHDVGTAPRHVRGDGHRAQASRPGDDLGLTRVVLGVEDLVLDTLLGQEEIGRASCRERACQYVLLSVLAVSLKKKITQ